VKSRELFLSIGEPEKSNNKLRPHLCGRLLKQI